MPTYSAFENVEFMLRLAGLKRREHLSTPGAA